MHELSIAAALVENAETAARNAGARSVNVVRLRLGALSGVVENALQFGYDIAVKNTLLAGSRLEIEAVPVVIYCDRCQCERELTGIQNFECPVCGHPSAQVCRGRELEMVSLEIEDDNPPA